MKPSRILLIASAATMFALPALANTPEQAAGYQRQWSNTTVTVTTERDGTITKPEWLSYQSQRFDDLKLRNHDHDVSKDEWLAMQSKKFDELDSDHTGAITQDEFVSSQDWAQDWYIHGVSTSRPQAYNQAIPTSHISGGADGAGGWTAQ